MTSLGSPPMILICSSAPSLKKNSSWRHNHWHILKPPTLKVIVAQPEALVTCNSSPRPDTDLVREVKVMIYESTCPVSQVSYVIPLLIFLTFKGFYGMLSLTNMLIPQSHSFMARYVCMVAALAADMQTCCKDTTLAAKKRHWQHWMRS